jgi:uncharacterized protein YukE
MNDPTKLIHSLEELLERLHKFDADLNDNFRRLDGSWQRLDKAWDGQARQEFSESWDKSRRMMRDYIERSSRYETFLRERIEQLRSFEKGQGGL